ncbi:MAG: hypothetical protein NTU60_04050 [Candidatus Aminicenantes bacterium]|nr:hypothetical protein [Candidatus Aminicenantes bacterium]
MAGKTKIKPKNMLHGARVYLSGPMDFVASRVVEKKFGWRNRLSEFLRSYEVTVFDPWNKPAVRGLHEYGQEGVDTSRLREGWTFEDSPHGAAARAKCSGQFWESMHIDLRMVDTSDFVIAYCPTNIYSVGTPHEIVVCRLQKKPVLFVSPKILFPALANLRDHLKTDGKGAQLLEDLVQEVPIKENPAGSPSFWYMTLVGGENFFDGFGFDRFFQRFPQWEKNRISLDKQEAGADLKRPLLPFLERLNSALPQKWDNKFKRYARNDDWLLWEFEKKKGGGLEVGQAHTESEKS